MTAVTVTDRQREILQLMSVGKTADEIACIQGISYNTVKTHKDNLMSKFEVYKDTALVAAALRRGVID